SLTGLCTGQPPEEIADEIADGGAAELKRTLTEAVNEFFAPIRRRRAEYAADPSVVHEILAAGNARANTIADATLTEVHDAMGTRYQPSPSGYAG
ncbi:MAG: tryptophan--tRNA ligase, partial [Stackebrandtia sp.]